MLEFFKLLFTLIWEWWYKISSITKIVIGNKRRPKWLFSTNRRPQGLSTGDISNIQKSRIKYQIYSLITAYISIWRHSKLIFNRLTRIILTMQKVIKITVFLFTLQILGPFLFAFTFGDNFQQCRSTDFLSIATAREMTSPTSHVNGMAAAAATLTRAIMNYG